MREPRVGVLARTSRGCDEVDFAGAPPQAAWTEPAIRHATIAFRTADAGNAPVESAAAIGFSSTHASIIGRRIGPAYAVHEVCHLRDPVQPRCQRADIRVGVTGFG